MDRRDALKVGLATTVIGCGTQSGSEPKKVVIPHEQADSAIGPIERFLQSLKEKGVSALGPVVSEKEREQVKQLEKQLVKADSKDPRAGTDYRLDHDSVKRQGVTVETVIRRCCGEGDYTFRVDPVSK